MRLNLKFLITVYCTKETLNLLNYSSKTIIYSTFLYKTTTVVIIYHQLHKFGPIFESLET